MVDEYNQSQDKVEIEYSSVNQTDYTTTLVTTAYANGECPDILWVEPATYKKFTEAGMLADLSSYYTDDLKKDILPSYLEAATGDDGKIYTLPFECETLGLFYDADVLKEEGIEPPTTWEELKSAAEKLTTDDRYGIVLPVEKTAYTLFNWWPFMWMDDADIYDADGNVTIGSDNMADALDFWGSFYQNGYCPSSLQSGPWSIDNIANGVAAMQIGGTYMINAAEEYNKDGHNIGVVPLPTPEGKDAVTVAGGQMLGVSSQSKDVDAAADFIFWCFGSDDTTYVTKWCTEAKFAYPARQSVIEENKELFQEDTMVLTLQNGAGNDRKIERYARKENIIIGTSKHNAFSEAPAVVRHTGSGVTTIGSNHHADELLKKLDGMLKESSLETLVSDDIQRIIWDKLFVNLSINAFTAIAQTPISYMIEDKYAWNFAKRLIYEAIEVAEEDGTYFDRRQVLESVKQTCKRLEHGYSSMYQDRKRKIKTEIDVINGAIVEQAKLYGVPVPYNSLIVDLVHAIEGAYEYYE